MPLVNALKEDTKTDRQTDGQTDRRTDRQTDRPIHTHTHTHTDMQTKAISKNQVHLAARAWLKKPHRPVRWLIHTWTCHN